MLHALHGPFRIRAAAFAELTSPLLRQALLRLINREEPHQVALAWLSDIENPIEVLHETRHGRAALAWQGAVEWTKADSVEDALERFFGIHSSVLEPPLGFTPQRDVACGRKSVHDRGAAHSSRHHRTVADDHHRPPRLRWKQRSAGASRGAYRRRSRSR